MAEAESSKTSANDGVQYRPRNLHIVSVTLCHCSPVHCKVTVTAIEGEKPHRALTDSQGTRRPGERRGKGSVHLRESGVQDGGHWGVPPLSVGQPTAGGGGEAVALCLSLVGCKGQYCSAV